MNDPLVVSYVTHQCTLVCDSLDYYIWHRNDLDHLVSDDFSYKLCK